MAAGNSCDVDVCDYVSYLAGDPGCSVITCIAEGLADGERLLEAAGRGMWAEPGPETLDGLRQVLLETEGDLEG